MSQDLGTAFAVLERSLAETERKANALRSAINTLCEEAGIPLKYPNVGRSAEHDAVNTQIQPDTFYGKKQSTAIRMFLEMRKAQGLGPATPREIFEALRAGGYQFETKNEINALVGLRALLRKNNVTFHRLPNGAYGLLSWYPDAKAGKPSDDDDDDATTPNKEATTSRKPVAASELRKAREPGKRGRPPKTPERKDKPDVDHRPDVTGPVTGAKVA
jgi:hypothetical protein